jgi:hypothetical protein
MAFHTYMLNKVFLNKQITFVLLVLKSYGGSPPLLAEKICPKMDRQGQVKLKVEPQIF